MPDSSTDTLNPLAKRTLRRLNDALESGQTGAMPEIVQTVRKLSGQIASVSVQDLSEIIERDPSVTEKVISAANTFGYNPSGVEIGTISQAIHTVGFERIRNLTLSVMLAQNAGKGIDNEQQREMASLSVCSGMLAQNLVGGSELFSADPDIAFVSGSLRNYGKLLMSTFFVDEYLAARSLAQQGGGDSAYHEVFGMTPLELGHTLLLGTNLPELIMASLERVPKEKLNRSAQSESEEILIASEFCVRVCELAFDESLSPDDFQNELRSIVHMFGDSLPVDIDMVVGGLEEVDSAMSQLNEVVGIKASHSHANRALRARLNGRPVTRPKKSTSEARESIGIGKPKIEGAQSLAELLELMEGGSGGMSDGQLGEVYTSLNKAISDELKLEGCMTFLQDTENSQDLRFSARHGTGALYERIKNRPIISSRNKDLFAICLNRKEDILIQDTGAGKIASVIPDWIHEKGDVKSLIVLPAAVGNSLFALFVGVKMDGASIEIEPVTHKRLKQFRSRLATLYASF
ncbi:HDOD domain-containing protein [Pelagicoccus mobilis]|uniref:HDOD domain-containing protein n=1 Tax=Pelagicoccus mobilis TaxID=415221 RepID=A0A934RY28_9BACT|nr:HDOD domain-containing protein [Pelagicoccus mobilis]MBK1878681.1 HDOD domain-containing protein [Pelagicoccus mobilis]